MQALLSHIVAVPMPVRTWGFGAIGKVAKLLAIALILVAEVLLIGERGVEDGAAQCATVLRRWEETQPDCQIPRVSMRPVEQAIWMAHRTRRARARRHNERQFKAHAALVVGALRRAEARQDSEPGRALEDLIVMLLTIAERYAEGRIDDLLDADQLAGADPAAPRERLRMLVFVLVMACAAILGLPEAALVPLLPVVVCLSRSSSTAAGCQLRGSSPI
ncbi:hypothetical protein [Streptomyces sp. NPDC001410]|uniref:hypothetical protein n=1 Tax=Streptomyces sp. NPDC001410 TaxID=3364574 RepID=UPI00368A7586